MVFTVHAVSAGRVREPGRAAAGRRRCRERRGRTSDATAAPAQRLGRRADQHRPQADRPEPRASARWSSSWSGGVFALLMRTQLAQPNDAVRLGQLLQRAVHDARLDDDLPVRHADGDGAGDVPGAAADRRDRDLGAAAGAGRVLDVAVRRAGHAVGLVHRRRRRARPAGSSYTPLSNGTNTPGVGQDLWVIGRDPRRGRDDR